MTSSSAPSNRPFGTCSAMLALRCTSGPSGTVVVGIDASAGGLAAVEAGAWAPAVVPCGATVEPRAPLAAGAELVATPAAPPHAASPTTTSEPSSTRIFWRSMAYGTRLAGPGNPAVKGSVGPAGTGTLVPMPDRALQVLRDVF